MLSPVQRLKIALFTEGMTVSVEASRQLGAGEERPLTLADYASTSGISMELEGEIWVNAPIPDFNPNFVETPPHRLDCEDGQFWVRSKGIEVRALPVPVPSYHDQLNRWGEPYRSLAITHTDRVRISPVEGCAIACQFCDLPYEFHYRRKPVDSLVDSVARAVRDPLLPAKHVLISGGTPRAEDYEFLNEVYARVAAVFPQLDVDVMMVPMPGLLDPERLHEAGIHGLSINLELWNPERARALMRPKARLGRDHFLGFIARAVEIFGAGKVRSLLVAGLEPMADTLQAVEALAQRGCDPVLSPFRPDPSTPLRHTAPPSIDFLAELYERSAETVDRLGVRLGPRCIPCQHNTLTFPEDAYLAQPEAQHSGAALWSA
ncbi:MAG TPA: radical SAM protein [Thermoanaerobaculia bacterium]|nr:radical SAM protein [Thermoanaerobaculia bacterium]